MRLEHARDALRFGVFLARDLATLALCRVLSALSRRDEAADA